MAASESLSGPNELGEREREAVEALLYRLADDEFVLADRYTDWQVRAPTVESDIAIANIAQDELGHARLWYDLLEDFGYSEPDLIWERDPETFRHSTLCELPFAEGDWADAIVRSYFYDEAEHLRLRALEDSSYPRIRDRVGKVLGEEDYHREHAENWLRRLVGGDEGRERVQEAVDELFPYALTLFEETEEDAAIDDLGIRTRSLADMRAEWVETVTGTLTDVGIDARAPETDEDGQVVADELPDHVGRDGDHTDHWASLYDDITNTYDELGRDHAARLMEDPDDE
ncbi:1,2-phenylacetyl-CoA epoxidase subunit PaaC [Halococcus sediminicola]|uniref:1,2-phenylacetyl-CoA epoxidase subunit PaaC n=1 Tax=Halococcus sediminicola TaxID=1264579 RepID=UPI000678A063|nr:1,2-phenylacetyl-CoA epoxidase subunit PaaC [Halococcus sediminicola]